jgi:hypothetical protein
LGLFNLIGCQSEQRPDGLPDLIPFQLNVTQDDQPCIGASVQLVSPEIPFPVTGQTDANGVARLVADWAAWANLKLVSTKQSLITILTAEP